MDLCIPGEGDIRFHLRGQALEESPRDRSSILLIQPQGLFQDLCGGRAHARSIARGMARYLGSYRKI